MADIVITIPTDKLPLVKEWVASRVSGTESWTDQEFAEYVDVYITSKFRAEIRSFQEREYLTGFVFDDPVT